MSSPLDLSRLFTRQLVAVGGQSLLLYDYFLTFPNELDYVWNAKWSTVKVVFILDRYGNLVGQSLYTLQQVNIFVSSSDKFCLYFEWFVTIFGILSGESIRFVVLLRAWAIWGCSRPVAITLIFAYLVYFTICAGISFQTMAIASKQELSLLIVQGTGVCGPRGAPNSWAVPLAGFFLDAFTSLMVLYPLAKLFKRTQRFRRLPIYRVLSRDAFLFFFTSVLTWVLTIICETLFVNDPRAQLMAGSLLPLATVVGQRLVLNLRELGSQAQSERIIGRSSERQIGVTRRASFTRRNNRWNASNSHEDSGDIEFRHGTAPSTI